tara:strand:+ start:174 stop:1610 length:1437 start_codon:yes stop_codon:yes gene_type:complete
MLHTPRMTAYERYIKQAELSNMNFVPKALDILNNTYDWSLHSSEGQNIVYNNPIHLKKLWKDLAKKCVEKLNGKFNEDEFDELFNTNFEADTKFLPAAFTNNETIIKTINTMTSMYFETMMYNFYKNGFDNFEIILKVIKEDINNFLNKWARILYHFHMFRQENNNTVLIKEDLLYALGDTEFPTSTEYLKSPFRSFYLMFEPNSIITNVKETNGITQESEKIKVDYEGAFINIENDTIKKGYTSIRIDVHIRITKKNSNHFSSLDPVNTYWELLVPKDESITNAIYESFKKTKGISEVQQQVMENSCFNEGMKEGLKSQLMHFTNIIIQVLLYMTSINRESVLIEGKKKKLKPKRIKKYIEREETQMNYNILGGTRTNYINGSVNKNKNYSNKNNVNKKLEYKTTVRGHWHSFWYKDEVKISEIPLFMHREEKYDDMGKKMIRCIKWIEPYIKGEGQEITKEYKMTSGGLTYNNKGE